MEEIESGLESTTSDASEGSSSEASVPESSGGESAQAGSQTKEQQTESTPFHEHPRFKELVEQKNQALAYQKQMEQQYKELQTQLQQIKESSTPKQKSEFDTLISDLKQIDPRLANALETQMKSLDENRSLKERLDKFERDAQESAQRAVVQNAVAKINSLHEANKVSPELKTMINDKLDLLYMQGKLNPQNVEAVYKEQHSAFKKYEDALTRSIRESYVADKKKDSATPTSQPKGQPAKTAPKKPNWSADKETAKQQVVSRFLKQQAANREAEPV